LSHSSLVSLAACQYLAASSLEKLARGLVSSSIGIRGNQILQAPVDHAHVCLLRGGKPIHKELDLNAVRDKENPGAIL